jgi:hypothetical protein
MGQITVWHAHDKSLLNEGQGSRPGRRAIDVVLKKELKYLYARLSRTPLGTIDNDAASCYDPIVCNLAMLISLYYGVPKHYNQLHANNLKNSQFRTRTALGDSDEIYSHSSTTPIHGTGQGSCASPALWLLISSFLMNILTKYGNGIQINELDDNDKKLLHWIEGFVDDTSIFTNLDYNDDNINLLREKLEEDGKIWSGLLQATGGKLELKKCFYYLLGWNWDSKGNPYPMTNKQTDEDNQGIILQTTTDTAIKLEQKDVRTSHKILGVYKNL